MTRALTDHRGSPLLQGHYLTMYYEHFGLREFPFKFSPSNSLFLSAAHLEGLAVLERAFREPSSLALLVGEVGTGRTMLIHALLARLNGDTVRIVRLSDPRMSFEEMLAVIVRQIGIHPAGRGKLVSLQALKTFLSDPAITDRVVLIFDEAQGLSDETLEGLRLLSNSSPPQRHALHIVLVGQPDLLQRLADPKLRALNQGLGARALLRPLRGAEIHDYVNYLLRAQGARHEVFSRDALVQVACLSGGLPRKINDLCHNSLLLAYSDGSTVVEPRHVQAASVEIEYLLDVSGGRDGQPIEVRRGAIHWMLGKGKPVMAGWLSALAIAGALVVEFGSGRSGAWFAHPAKVHTHRAQDLSEFSKPLSASPSQSHEEPQSEAQIAAPLWSSQSANHDGVPPRRAPVADAPHPVAAKARAENTGATLIDPPSGFLPEMQKTLTSTNSVSPEPAVTPPTSYDSLTYEQERKLRYEIRRAQSSFGVGQYTNAVYHLKRALLLDPGSSEIRDLLQRAQAAQLKPEKSAGSTAPSPAPPAAVAWPDYRPEMPLGEPSGSASGEISAPPVSAAEDLPPVNSGGPSARASEEVAVPPVPAAEHLPPLNGGGSLARASGKVAPTPDSPTALHTASAEQVPAARRTLFNIQIQAAMDQKNAERMVDRLRQLGYQPHLVTNGIGGQTWYQVEIGPYPSHDEAAAAKATLRLKYDSTFDPPAPNPGDDSPDLLNPFSPTPLPIGLSAER